MLIARPQHMPLQGDDFVLQHSRDATRFIFAAVPSLAPKARRAVLTTLAEAFQSCQAEQARVIDELFGMLSGRDKGLREQVCTGCVFLHMVSLSLSHFSGMDTSLPWILHMNYTRTPHARCLPQSRLAHTDLSLATRLAGVGIGRLPQAACIGSHGE